jgi:hypothetical protein
VEEGRAISPGNHRGGEYSEDDKLDAAHWRKNAKPDPGD